MRKHGISLVGILRFQAEGKKSRQALKKRK